MGKLKGLINTMKNKGRKRTQNRRTKAVITVQLQKPEEDGYFEPAEEPQKSSTKAIRTVQIAGNQDKEQVDIVIPKNQILERESPTANLDKTIGWTPDIDFISSTAMIEQEEEVHFTATPSPISPATA